jgi:uncharacterized RDD family membrane protein YckC
VADQATYGGPIVTGEAVALEVRPAGIGSRGVGLAIDLLAQYALILFVSLVATNLLGGLDTAGAQAAYIVLMVLIILGYPVGMETLWRGRTLGKAAMGLRVVRDDGGPIRFRHAFVRGLVGVVIDKPGLSLGLLAFIPMLMTARSKRLGDLSAGTVVVQERIPARVSAPPTMPPGAQTWAATLDLSGVGDALALEVRQFLARSGDLAPWAREQMGSRLLSELAARAAPPPPGMEPGVYFAAVLAERRRRELERAAPPSVSPPPAAPPSAPAPSPAAKPPSASAPPEGPFAPPA